MDLIYLFLCSIHTIRYFLHSRPQLVQSIMNEVIFPKRELKIIHFEEKHEVFNSLLILTLVRIEIF